MAEAIALQVVVLHLAHALDAQRLPRQILAGAPAALPAGHARVPCACASAHSRHGCSSSASSRSGASSAASSLARRHRERRGDADVVQPAVVVVEAEQQRADARRVPLLCQRKPATTQSAVRACLILIIARLPGWYGAVRRLGDHAVEPGAFEALRASRRRARGRASSASGGSAAATSASSCSSARAPLALRLRRAGRVPSAASRSKATNDAGVSLRQLGDARRRRVQAQLQRVEVEAAGVAITISPSTTQPSGSAARNASCSSGK